LVETAQTADYIETICKTDEAIISIGKIIPTFRKLIVPNEVKNFERTTPEATGRFIGILVLQTSHHLTVTP
jgi:hypothetical protein